MKEYQCPKCKTSDEFEIEGYVSSILCVDSENRDINLDTGDEYHEDTSIMRCVECQHEGTVKDFRVG